MANEPPKPSKPPRLIGDVLLVVVPKIAAGVASVFLNLFVVRYLPPAGFGFYSYALFLIQIADGTFSSAIDLAVIQYTSHRDVTQRPSPMELAGLVLKSLFGLGILAIVLVAGRPLSELLLSTPDAQHILWIAAAGAIGIFVFRSLQTYFQIRENFKTYGAYDLAQTLLRTSSVALVLWWSANELQLLTAYVAAPWITAAAIALFSFRPRWDKNEVLPAFHKLARQSYHTIRTYGIGAIVSRLDLLAVGWLLTPADVGLYGLCISLLLAPELVGSSLANVFAPKIPQADRDGTLASLFRGFHRPVFALCLVISMIGPWLIPSLGSWVLPANYHASLKILAILLPGALANALLFPMTLNYLMMRSPKAFFYWDLILAPILIGTYWITGTHWGVAGIAFAASTHRVVKAAFLFFRSYRLLGESRWKGDPVGEV